MGGPNNQADVLMVIESDDREDMLDELLRIEESIIAANLDRRFTHRDSLCRRGNESSSAFKRTRTLRISGRRLPTGLARTTIKDPNDVLTLRQNPNKRDLPKDPTKPASPTNLIQPAQGKPGQDLLYPGEFIFGYPRQIPTEDPAR